MRRSRRLSALACILAAAAAVAGCGGGSADSQQTRTRADTGPARTGANSAQTRTNAHSPDSADPRAASCFRAPGHRELAGELVDIPRRLPSHPPVLVAFHGLREAATWLANQTQFDALAAKHGFVVAYPNAVRAQKWQLNHREGDDDVQHIGSFVDALVRRVCADPDRVYLTGFSNGAGFAYRAGCELRDRVAAIAPVSGSYRLQDRCDAGPMPTLEIHGRDPWTETVPRVLADMKRRNNCTRAPVTRRVAPGITRTRWPGCDLEHIYNRTIGHEWPKLGPYNTSVEVWRFVSRYRRSGG